MNMRTDMATTTIFLFRMAPNRNMTINTILTQTCNKNNNTTPICCIPKTETLRHIFCRRDMDMFSSTMQEAVKNVIQATARWAVSGLDECASSNVHLFFNFYNSIVFRSDLSGPVSAK